MKKTLLLLAAFACLLAPELPAREVPAPTGRYVSDFASMLSASVRQELEEALAAFDRDTSNQILVVTIPSLEGDVLEDFSIRLAGRWKPGTKKNDNGAILLISRDDRAVRIEVGYGLEGALPDATAKSIIENEIVPRFRAGDVDGGVRDGLRAMMEAARGEYQATGSAEDAFQAYAPGLFVMMILSLLLPWVAYPLIAALAVATFGFPAGLIAALILIFFLHLLRRALMGHATFAAGGGFGPGGFSGGGSSGGFSGGGGSFGGGGASGRW